MRFYFTEEDRPTDVRANDLRAALVHARHRVVHGSEGVAAPPDTDVWFHGLGLKHGGALREDTARALDAFAGTIVFFQVCDVTTMWFQRIPERLAGRAHLFLRNHWPSDRTTIPERFRDRLGWMPPMVPFLTAHPGAPLRERSRDAIFFGTKTGGANLADGRNAREETVRLLAASGLRFEGGLCPHEDPHYAPAPDVIAPRMHEREHARRLLDTRLCVAPWGNHVLTYRLFEGLARRCVVVAQSIARTSFLDGGLEPGKHYVEVDGDLHDLVAVSRAVLADLDRAQRIADAGHAHFRRHFEPRGSLISSWLFDAVVASWRGLYRPSDDADALTRARSLAARVFPRRW